MFIHQLDSESYLKLLQMHDADSMFYLIDSCRPYLRSWLPWVDGTRTVQDSRDFIQFAMQQFGANSGLQAGIWHRGELAGVIGFHKFDWANRSASIGYWLGERFQGKGLMTKACKSMVQFALVDMGLNRVEIRCAVQNLKSRAIPERLGFVQEGCVRQTEWLYDRYVDHFVYGMLAEEWNGR